MAAYDLALVVLGLAALLVGVLPRLLKQHHPSFPLLFVFAGLALGHLGLPFLVPHPLDAPRLTERLTELGVIVALTAAGLKLDRRIGLRRWALTWRLLGITMPLTILAVAVLGWGLLGFAPAAALLVAAALAPTDPVLASEVQVDPPREGEEDEVRVALTSEAGLNDGLAFPYTHAALAIAGSGVVLGPWIGPWLLVDVGYRIVAGALMGAAVGRLLGALLFRIVPRDLALDGTEALVAIATTLAAYGAAELLGGYGFISVFAAALALRDHEREHTYHREMHDVAEQTERFAAAVILLLFGATIATGLLAPLTWTMAFVALALLLVVRPIAGLVGLAGSPTTLAERATISFLGIRGTATFYYLAFGLNAVELVEAEELWALAGFAVLASVVLHGLTAGWLLARLRAAET